MGSSRLGHSGTVPSSVTTAMLGFRIPATEGSCLGSSSNSSPGLTLGVFR